MTFKESYRDLEELVREHSLLRAHNGKFKDGDPQDDLLLFAEASLILTILERFLRVLPALKAKEGDSLRNLLERAISKKVVVLDAPDQQIAIKQICDVRNTILHGNFEQAAKQAGLESKEEYFKSQFASEIEALYKITNGLFAQIDPLTGHPLAKGNLKLSSASKLPALKLKK